MHLIFYGTYWLSTNNEQIFYQMDWNILLNSGTVLQRLSEYGIATGSLDVNSYNAKLDIDTETVSGNTTLITTPKTFDDINLLTPEINNEILAGTIPFPNDNTLYVVMLPTNVISKNMADHGWSAYHGDSSYGKTRYAFAVVSYNAAFNKTNSLISHELYEAATDPDAKNGYYEDNDGKEIGDLCGGSYEYIDGMLVQKVWSQMTCMCL